MINPFFTRKVNEKLWSLSALYRIETIPSSISEKTFRQILTNVSEKGTSLELFFVSGEKKVFPLELYLLIRIKGTNPLELSPKMTRLTDNFQTFLSYSGISVSIQSEDDIREFDFALSNRRTIALLVPGGIKRKSKFQYLPAGYDACEEIDLAYISSIISEHRDAGLSMQMTRAAFLPEEVNAITVNLEKYRSHQSEESLHSANVFSHYMMMQNDMIFFTCLTIWGDDSSLNLILNSLHSSGYEAVLVPSELFYECSYFGEGDILLQKHACENGHITPPGVKVPFGCMRLDYLTDAAGTIKFLNKINNLSELKGVAGVANSFDIKKIPDKYIEGTGLNIGCLVGTDKAVTLPEDNLVKHAVISGMPGSGKTSLIFKILNELYLKGVPFIAIEPAKTEYRELLDTIPDLKILTPGRTDVSPVMFNPFIPPKNISLEQFLPSLEEAFNTAFSMTTPLDVIFPEALRNCYAEYGWTADSTSDSPGVTAFGMHEFICSFKREVQRSNYDPESKQNLMSGGTLRFQSLLNANNYLFDTDKAISFEELLNGHSIIELDAIDNPEHKALVLSLILMQIKLVIRRNQKKDSILKNILLLDEAHVILGASDYKARKNEADPSGKIRKSYIEMVKVNRAYGTGMIFADQSLSILEDFVNNSDVKITMHLENADERQFLASNLGYSSEIYNNLGSLAIGQYYMSCEDIREPLLIQAPDTRAELSIRHDISDEEVADRMKVRHQRPFITCTCKKYCDISIRNEAEYLARKLIGQISEEMLKDNTALEKYMKLNLNDALGPMVEDSDNEKKLLKCTRLQFERMIKQRVSF